VSANHSGEFAPFRVLVCGSRTFRDGTLVEALLSSLDGGSTVIHGAAKGADSLADFHARRIGLAVDDYPADWDRYGKRAGYVRNQQMLDEGKPNVVYAFVDKPLAESKGTAMMVDIAHRAGVPVVIVQALWPPHMDSSEAQS
jgi:hypothetical protein